MGKNLLPPVPWDRADRRCSSRSGDSGCDDPPSHGLDAGVLGRGHDGSDSFQGPCPCIVSEVVVQRGRDDSFESVVPGWLIADDSMIFGVGTTLAW
jgi:hypothetical protein